MVLYLLFKWFICGQDLYLQGNVKIDMPGFFQWIRAFTFIIVTVLGDIGVFLNAISALIAL